ncbi:MAG: hypothetical protein ACNI26_13010 [Terasakiella sp.]|uniref:hypothetical protein n=1 Tax=unclassified Terasakiella TaxID=2614952 RepID=UPI003AFF7AC4
MALTLSVKTHPSLPPVENAYHHIVGASINYDGIAVCMIQSYKDVATRQAHKLALADMEVLQKDHAALHQAILDAHAAKDEAAEQQAQFDFLTKGMELKNKQKELESVAPFTGPTSTPELDITGIQEVTRADLYNAIKTLPEWADAEDA